MIVTNPNDPTAVPPPERTRFAEPAPAVPTEPAPAVPAEPAPAVPAEPLDEPVAEPVAAPLAEAEPAEPAVESVPEPVADHAAELPTEPVSLHKDQTPLGASAPSVATPLSAAVEVAALPAVPQAAPEPNLAATEPDLAAPEPDLAAPEPDPAGPPAPSARGVLVPVLAALVVVLTVLTGVLVWLAVTTRGPAPVEASRREALGAARDAARLVFSYDYRTLPKDFAAGRAVTTGGFRKEYDRTTQKLVDDVAPRYKAVVAADVIDASVVRATENEVVCLVFVNQASTSTQNTQPKITVSRLEMTLVRRGDDWLVEDINAL